MKTEINDPVVSKINWTALVIQIIALLSILDVIPAEAQQPVAEITMLLGPTLIQIFRTRFTKPRGEKAP